NGVRIRRTHPLGDLRRYGTRSLADAASLSMSLSGSPNDRCVYQFDEFVVDHVRRLLLRRGEPVPVTPKALSLLLLLLQRPGDLATKVVLLGGVGPDASATGATLPKTVSPRRGARGGGADDRRYIRTVAGQGYAFQAEVREVAPEEEAEVSPP